MDQRQRRNADRTGGVGAGLPFGERATEGVALKAPNDAPWTLGTSRRVPLLLVLLLALLLGCDEDSSSPTAPVLETEHVVWGYGATQSQCWENLRTGRHAGGLLDQLARRDCGTWTFRTGGSAISLVDECPSQAVRSDGLCYYCTETVVCRR